MTLFSNDSTILEEVSIDYYENKVATYDDYCDDTYAIKSSEYYIYKTCHDYDYPFRNITLLMWKQFIVFKFLMVLPLFRTRRISLMWRVIKFICLGIMKRMLYVMVIFLNSFMILLKIIMKKEYMLVGIAIISRFLSMCLKF